MQTLSYALDFLQIFIRRPCYDNQNPSRKYGYNQQILVENLPRLIIDGKQLSFTQNDKKITDLGKTRENVALGQHIDKML